MTTLSLSPTQNEISELKSDISSIKIEISRVQIKISRFEETISRFEETYPGIDIGTSNCRKSIYLKYSKEKDLLKSYSDTLLEYLKTLNNNQVPSG